MRDYIGAIERATKVMEKITITMVVGGLLSAGVAIGYIIVSKGKVPEENRKVVEYLFADGLTAAAVGAFCHYRFSKALRKQDGQE